MKHLQLKKHLFLSNVLLLTLAFSGCSTASSKIADVSTTNTTFILPTTVENSSIYIEPIEDLPDSFIRGMDVSSILSEEKSGVVYYGFDGNPQDVFTTLAEAGVNYARIRVWNDPYDKDGNGYGGGNNDLNTAIELGKRATANGMKVCIDFHYSDFWADPGKQIVPKAWKDMSLNDKSDALYNYTSDSLKALLDAGVNVCMVQIGNETNNGMAGETVLPNITQLMKSGSKAIREISDKYNKEIKIALHYTNITDTAGINNILYKLSSFQVDYDIFAISYYPYWHGSFENLQKVMLNIKNKYNKETLIAETSYCYTLEDGDDFPNSVDESILVKEYGATIQSQATALRDVFYNAYQAGGLGVFYWEGAWIPVGSSTATNKSLWEKYGSGWASKYASEYDPNDAGKYYGGCSWDNQALFDHTGKPLDSLNTFKWLHYGTNAEPAIDMIASPNIACNLNSEIILPETVSVTFNNRALNKELPVEWDKSQLEAIDTSHIGKYEISGQLKNITPTSIVRCNLSVEMLNHVQNPSFEDEDTSMWKVEFNGSKNPTDILIKQTDAHSGDHSFHFWSENNMDFSIEQSFTNLEPGKYMLKAFFQGGDINNDSEMQLYANTGSNILTDSFKAQGYSNWQEPHISEIVVSETGTLTIGIKIRCNAKGWGTIDDITLNKID